jgi:prevent-host-death family protein
MSRRVGIRELRQNLSQTIREVELGDSVEVTRAGETVARIVPVRHATKLDQLIAEGNARPALRPLDLTRPLRKATGPMSASEALDWLRGE